MRSSLLGPQFDVNLKGVKVGRTQVTLTSGSASTALAHWSPVSCLSVPTQIAGLQQLKQFCEYAVRANSIQLRVLKKCRHNICDKCMKRWSAAAKTCSIRKLALNLLSNEVIVLFQV